MSDWSEHTEPGATVGRLLVATPLIGDPNFERTVVLMIEHNEEGALGVVLNRPSDTDVADTVPGWETRAAEPPVVFVGGPVSPEAVLGLGRSTGAIHDDLWSSVLGPIGTVDLNRDPLDLPPALGEVRLFAGYAGWASTQLEAELRAGAWFVLDGDPEDVLTADPEALWSAVLARQRGVLQWFANYPEDAHVN